MSTVFTTTSPSFAAPRTRAARAGDGVIAGYIRSLTQSSTPAFAPIVATAATVATVAPIATDTVVEEASQAAQPVRPAHPAWDCSGRLHRAFRPARLAEAH